MNSSHATGSEHFFLILDRFLSSNPTEIFLPLFSAYHLKQVEFSYPLFFKNYDENFASYSCPWVAKKYIFAKRSWFYFLKKPLQRFLLLYFFYKWSYWIFFVIGQCNATECFMAKRWDTAIIKFKSNVKITVHKFLYKLNINFSKNKKAVIYTMTCLMWICRE